MKLAFLAKARPDLKARIPATVDYVMIEAGEGGVYSSENLALVADADAFVVSQEPVNEQILAAAPKVKIAQRLGVGYETLDLKACSAHGIPACNIEGVNKEAVAEHAFLLILALAKKLLTADELTHAGEWGDARMLTKDTFEVAGKTLGIIGLGNTGGCLARRAKGFEMNVVYNDIADVDPKVVESCGAKFVEKEELYKMSDIVSINADLNDQSRNMIDARALSLMKPGALFVCCARGGIVDEDALRAALESGHIAGAGVDVFQKEPIAENNPLLGAPNTLLTAHVAGITEETNQRVFDWAMDNVRAVVERGEPARWVRNER